MASYPLTFFFSDYPFCGGFKEKQDLKTRRFFMVDILSLYRPSLNQKQMYSLNVILQYSDILGICVFAFFFFFQRLDEKIATNLARVNLKPTH